MRKKLTDYIQVQTNLLNEASAALIKATNKFKAVQVEVNRLNDFEHVGINDYILSTKGKGTVLHVLGTPDQPVLKVYIGAGDTAEIILVRYWEFQEVLKWARDV